MRQRPGSTQVCLNAGAERCVWRTFTRKTESDSSEDSFSDDPEEWMDSSESIWRYEGKDDGVSLFDYYCPGRQCQLAEDWDRPITECRARVNTPAIKVLLEIAKGGLLTALAISEDGLTRLLDAAILLGQVDAVTAVVANYPQPYRTVRLWAIEDLITTSNTSINYRSCLVLFLIMV